MVMWALYSPRGDEVAQWCVSCTKEGNGNLSYYIDRDKVENNKFVLYSRIIGTGNWTQTLGVGTIALIALTFLVLL